jgi:hypothetical protein
MRMYEGPNAFGDRTYGGKEADRLEAVIQVGAGAGMGGGGWGGGIAWRHVGWRGRGV